MSSQSIRDHFDAVAGRYDEHAALEREVCSRLIERTEFRRQDPQVILDLGCGSGYGSAQLKRQFRKAQLVGLDVSRAMLLQMRRRSSLMRPIRGVCGDIAALPFPSQRADMVFSNLAACWGSDLMAVFSEFRRVLRPDGMLLFSTLGPASLKEVRDAQAMADVSPEALELPDLLEIGDALVAAGFRDPVMDMENITLQYPSVNAMLRELEATGSAQLIPSWSHRNNSPDRSQKAFAPLQMDGKYPLTYEIIYGVAFGPEEGAPRKTPDGDVATFSVASLLKTRSARR